MYKFAIVGCGNIAQQHAEQIRRTGILSAVCDTELSRAKDFGKKFEVRAYDSIDTLLANETDVDVISICTPNGFHAEHSIKSLQAGRNVICETPFCLTKAGAWQTIETEKFCRRKLFVPDPVRLDDRFKSLKDLLPSQEVTRFELNCTSVFSEHYKGWRGKIFPGGGALYTELNSYLSLLVFLFGDVVRAQGSVSHRQQLETEDGLTVELKMQSGASGSIRWSFGADPDAKLSLKTGNDFQDIPVTNLQSDYHAVYDQLQLALSNQPHQLSDLYQVARTVEATEKIYKSILPNTSADH
jgi:UDP-N-acetyl-2-amino-2-deoxyglucuronate dehydrogenase